MTVTASSGSPRVSPQLYDTLPLSSVRQAEQQDRFPDGGELDTLITFFRSGNDRLDAARLLASNAESIVARAANRIFVGGTPLSFLEEPLSTGKLLPPTPLHWPLIRLHFKTRCVPLRALNLEIPAVISSAGCSKSATTAMFASFYPQALPPSAWRNTAQGTCANRCATWDGSCVMWAMP